MIEGLIGIKLGMTQVFSKEGGVIPVTVLKAGPCVVIQKKNRQTDGYEAVQLGFVEPTAERKVSKALLGHFKKSGLPPTRRIREFKILSEGGQDQRRGPDHRGDVPGGRERGRDRHQQGEGVRRRDEAPPFPGRRGEPRLDVPPGARIGGGLGLPLPDLRGNAGAPATSAPARITVKNLQVVRVDAENHLLVVRGAVPGADGGYLVIRRSPAPRKIQQVKAAVPAAKKAAKAPKRK